MGIVIAPADLAEVFWDRSFVVVTGTSQDGRRRITFVGSTRSTRPLLDAVKATGQPHVAIIRPRQIRGIARV